MNKTITAVLLLALAAPAAAQQKKSPGQEPRPKAAAPAPAPAKKPAPAAEAAETPEEKAIRELKAWDSRLDSLEADFTQEVSFTEAGLKQSIEGKLQYVKPNLLRIEHIKPSRQLVVTDKADIWIYKPEDKQVVKTAWEAWRKTQDQNFSGILDFGNYSSLTARNETKVEGGKGGAPFTVTFTPRSGAAYTLKLTLSATDYFPSGAELSVDGTVIRTTLTSVTKNGEIDRKIFKFTPPKGTETLEFKN